MYFEKMKQELVKSGIGDYRSRYLCANNSYVISQKNTSALNKSSLILAEIYCILHHYYLMPL